MLQIRNLKIIHRKDLRILLEDFSVTLNDGDKAVIIGEEGNGKSTLLKWIYDPGLIESYAEAKGERITGRERLAYLPQELPPADAGKTLYDFFSEEPVFLEKNPRELSRMASDFHTDNDFFFREQTLESLSGGEKIKAQLMRLLMCEPTVLLLDEPSNDLDIETLEFLEEFIRGQKHIVLFVSHDETLIENTANMIIHLEQVMKKQKSRYTIVHDTYGNYMKYRADQFERQAQQAQSDLRQKRIRDEKYRRIMQSVEHAQAVITRQDPHTAANLKKKMHAVKSMGRRFEKEDENMTRKPEQEEAIFFTLGDQDSEIPAGKTVCEFRLDILMTPDGKRQLSRDITLSVHGSEKVCITGLNGCGKTTLLKQIAEELQKRPDLRVVYMPQNYEDLLDLDQTPAEYLSRTGDKEEITRIRTHLGSLKYTTKEMEHPIRELSGGQKAKVFLLKMSLSKANVLILDEPTRNFSPLSGPVIRRMLSSFPGAVISVSHDRKYISEVCTKIYVLTENGLKNDLD